MSSSFEVRGETLCVRLGEGGVVQSVEVECVVDMTHYGDVAGIEILDFRRQLPRTVVQPAADESMRWSYDPEVDAFYLHLRDVSATSQVKTVCRALLRDGRVLIGFEADLGRTSSAT
jgi:uncharacterized protein YuzE